MELHLGAEVEFNDLENKTIERAIISEACLSNLLLRHFFRLRCNTLNTLWDTLLSRIISLIPYLPVRFSLVSS